MSINGRDEDVPFAMTEAQLYREESYTDLRVGTIKRLTPVKLDGSTDASRASIFVGFTQVMSPKGPLPIQNMIPAKDLNEAILNFPDAMNQAVEKLVAAAEKARQNESSRIVIPGKDAW